MAASANSTWELDRELVLSRVFDAPCELVFRVWTDREHFAAWFGPAGFAITTHEADIRVGGRWRFDIRGPDGKVYPNRGERLGLEARRRRTSSRKARRARSRRARRA